MQLSIPLNAMKAASSGFSTRGGTLTSSLTLFRNPQGPLESTTKGYVDTAVTSIPANALDKGTLSVQRFPSFSGDAVKINGGDQITLSPSGVTAGSYPKVSVDGKGRITAAYPLSVDDIPSLNWTKISTNVPTNINDYGITNAVRKNGDTMTGFVELSAPPTQSFHLASKNYADQIAGTGSRLNTGDVISHLGTSLTGFLRCNGALVNKASYTALYTAVGDKYSTASAFSGSGRPWRAQYVLNTTQDGDLTSWVTETQLPQAISQSQIIITKSKVYIIAGYVNTTVGISAVYSAIINVNGTLGSWVAETSFPVSIHSSQAIVIKNRVYMLGGIIGGSQSSSIYYAVINSDGTLGVWTLYGNLPVNMSSGQAIITSTRIYMIGGTSDGLGVYSTDIASDGSLGTWIAETNLPANCNWAQAVVTNNRVYLMGNNTTTVYTAVIGGDGFLGDWSAVSNSLPAPTRAAQAVIVNKHIYLIGGHNPNGTFHTNVFHAPVNPDGTIGTWSYSNATLPASMGYSQALVTTSKIYLLGQQGANQVYSIPFAGGLNDYSGYYDGTITVVNPTTFKLPDYSSFEVNNLNYFIKY